MNTRALAADVITRTLNTKTPLSQVLSNHKAKLQKEADQSLLQALCYGVFRFYPRLAFLARALMEKPLKNKDLDILHLIFLGLFQMLEMRVPDHAAISETVNACQYLKKPWAKGLINGVLRNFQRQSETLLKKVADNPAAATLHPNWLLKAIQQAWPDQWEEIVTANNAPPPLVLRVNLQKISRAAYLQQLLSQQIEAEIIDVMSADAKELDPTPTAIRITHPCDATALPGYHEGLFSVQDAASQWAAAFLELSPGLRVLDACAAPGGKLAHLLETEPKLLEVVALDLSPQKTQRIQENLDRLGLHAKIQTANALQPADWWDGNLFDRILCDAPCSATGIIRRHPDIKMLRHKDDIQRLATQQLQLLQTLWPLLKPDGILVYATCSILPAENSAVIQKFLDLEKDVILLATKQILPGQNDMDGFYYARVQKKAKHKL